MGCNCNKNKTDNNQTIQSSTTESSNETTPVENLEFRKQEAKKQSRMTMMQSFATAIASRGFNNEKVTIPMKQLRVISCFGNKAQGGVLPSCEHLKQSTTPGKFYCGGCGCGDRKGTWLLSNAEEYSKLDYPRLTCPLQMPGFSNYEKSKEDEAVAPITRRYYIEQLPYKEIEKIPVTTHSIPIPPPVPPSPTAEQINTENKN